MTQYLVLTELTNSNAIKIMKNSLTEQQNRIYSLKIGWKHTQILI